IRDHYTMNSAGNHRIFRLGFAAMVHASWKQGCPHIVRYGGEAMRAVPRPRTAAVLFPALLIAGTMILIALFPDVSLQAALTGISIWWEVLFPSLFPFFVVSELMLGFGIVHFFGTLLDPMMRPLFRLPGPGGFVMALGFASGYPIGARLTA